MELKSVVVSGIGCSGRISSYFDGFTLHTTHGRPLIYASGIKAAKQEAAKEINSREGIMINGKFEKYVDNASKAKWYKANYTICKT